MGVTHFAGLGRSPGAVTAGLAYLKHEYGDHKEYGQIVEAIVIFTSSEIIEGKEEAFESVHKEYMSMEVRKMWAKSEKNAVKIVTEFIKREIRDATLFLCEVNVNDFSDCFEKVAKCTLRFHPPGEVGKHIWANITGGTNPLNAALFQTAFLSGFISRLYYTFIADPRQYGKYLQPFSSDKNLFDFREIYVLKTTFDERYQQILEELEHIAEEDPNKWITAKELLNRLKNENYSGFQQMDENSFVRNFLHIMQDRGIQRRDKEDVIRLDQVGKTILSILRANYMQALLRSERISPQKIEKLTENLPLKKYYEGSRKL